MSDVGSERSPRQRTSLMDPNGVRAVSLDIANGIREFAVASPDVTAVIDGDRSITYAELDERSSRLSQALIAAGVEPGGHVGVLLGNRLEYPEIAAGIAKCGAVMVPFNPRLTAPEVTNQFDHAGIDAFVMDAALADIARPTLDDRPVRLLAVVDGDGDDEYEGVLDRSDATDPEIRAGSDEPFCIAYTSGTTGNPKGVVISHRSRVLTFYATALEWGLGPGRRTIAVAPMYHGAGFAFAYAAVVTGGTVAMLRSFDAAALLDMVADVRPHTVFLVPAHANMLRALGDDAVAAADTSSLEVVYFNAAPLPQAVKLWFMDVFPHVEVHELYGSTEAGIVSNLRHPLMREKETCVGPPWFMTEVRLLDLDGNEVPNGEPGELYSRSPFLMNGYFNDPDATAACTTADGWLTSGDVAIRDDDNCLYIVDRVKDLIISGGVNVYPREVEEVLATHPAVREAAVVGVPDDQWGELVTAVVVTTEEVHTDDLDAHCRASLAGFKVPRRYEFSAALPRNATMKVLKRELRATLADGGSVA